MVLLHNHVQDELHVKIPFLFFSVNDSQKYLYPLSCWTYL